MIKKLLTITVLLVAAQFSFANSQIQTGEFKNQNGADLLCRVIVTKDVSSSSVYKIAWGSRLTLNGKSSDQLDTGSIKVNFGINSIEEFPVFSGMKGNTINVKNVSADEINIEQSTRNYFGRVDTRTLVINLRNGVVTSLSLNFTGLGNEAYSTADYCMNLK